MATTAKNRKLTLISHDLCPYVQRSVITLLEKGVAHERVYVDLADKPDWFTAVSPLGKVPLLRIDDNEVLFESAVICEYLDETTGRPLMPTDPLERAHHRAWIEFASNVLNVIGGFYNAPDGAVLDEKRQVLRARFEVLEENLGDHRFFAGPKLSLVDAAFGPVFRYFEVFEAIADFGFFDDLVRVNRWRRNLCDHPAVKAGAIADYHHRLLAFVKRRNSHLSALISDAPPTAFDWGDAPWRNGLESDGQSLGGIAPA